MSRVTEEQEEWSGGGGRYKRVRAEV